MRLDELVQQYNSEKKLAYGIAIRQDDGTFEATIDDNDLSFSSREELDKHSRNFIIVGMGKGKPPKSL